MARIARPQGKSPIRLRDGRVIGQREGAAAVFTVRRSRHYYRAIGGYSIDERVLREIASWCRAIRFRDVELGQDFEISFETFMRQGRPVDHGYGVKRVAPAALYREIGQGSLFKLPLFEAPEARPRGHYDVA